MKLITFLTCLVFIFTKTVQAQWIVEETPHTKTLYCVYFADENNGLICGDETISRTTNGGIDWSDTHDVRRINHLFHSIAFAGVDSGYACGVKIIPDFDPTLTVYLPSYAQTTNSGDSWIFPTSWGSAQGRWRSVCFINNNTGWLAGYYSGSGILYKTIDGINNFNFQFLFPELLYSSCFIDDNNGWVCGRNGYMSRTTDGGESWTDQNTKTEFNLYSIKFTNATNGFAVGYKSSESIVLNTSDGGENWHSKILPVRMLNTVFTLNKDIAWIGGSIETSEGNKGIILYTSDGGTSWETQYTSESSSTIYSIYFVGATLGWAVGSSGEILKTTTGGVTSVNGETHKINSFILLQNYPNPFNPLTKINYSISQQGYVTLKVYDILGNEIESLVNEEKSVGSYEVDFNASNLSSGVYFYRLQAGSFVETKKMILLK